MKANVRTTAGLALLGAALLLAGCERPPVQVVQHGYRGTGMDEVYNPRTLAKQGAANAAPAPIGEPIEGGPPASAVFKNVPVLGDVGVAEFTRLMVAMTTWVSPEQGCAYCHVTTDMASDELYTKVVARRMLQMTQAINVDYKNHVADTGVTCYTCHRGLPVPANVWFTNNGPATTSAYAGNKAGQNTPAPQVNLSSLPFDPFTPFLDQNNPIRVVSNTALPTGNRQSIKQTEWTYALMLHMSQSLGVNCTYCHNSRSFSSWDQSTPQRATAYYGLSMVRGLNGSYLDPLATTLPANRHGPLGDGPKVNCTTCHQGAFKPLYGAKMVKDYPELARHTGTAEAAAIGVAPGTPPAPGTETPALSAPRADASGSAVLVALIGTIYFDTGKATIAANSTKAVSDAATVIKGHDGLKVALSGFADKTGNADQNLELAKQRALAVRDALKGAGVDDARIDLRKPEFAVGGAEAESRRVDIVATP